MAEAAERGAQAHARGGRLVHLAPVRALVTGSNGLLGTKLLELLIGRDEVEVGGVSRGPCANRYLGEFAFWQADLAEPGSAARVYQAFRPEVVVHTAAMTDVDGCEQFPDGAWRENVDATRLVADAARCTGARLVHLSTEYVFDGTAGPYVEDDPTNPLGVYGRSKLVSEAIVLERLADSAIARTTVLFGQAPNARPNFVTGLLQRWRAGERTRIVTDQVGSPTLADNLAQMVWALAADSSARGVFNTVGASVVDRCAFAEQIASAFGTDPGLIEPIDTPSLKQAARRPLRAGLKMDKFRDRFPGVPVLSSIEALDALRRQLAPADGLGAALAAE